MKRNWSNLIFGIVLGTLLADVGILLFKNTNLIIKILIISLKSIIEIKLILLYLLHHKGKKKK